MGRGISLTRFLLLLHENNIDEDREEMQAIVNQFTEITERIASRESMKEITMEEFELVVKELKKKKAADEDGWRYEFFIYGGEDLKKSVLKIINILTKRYYVPTEWKEMIIKSISKGKGDLRSMNSRRGLFLTNCLYFSIALLTVNKFRKLVH